MTTALTPELRDLGAEIRQHAVNCDLDFFEVIFELLDYDELNMIAAYGGFPTRYPHWRFGMDFREGHSRCASRGTRYGNCPRIRHIFGMYSP